MKKILEDLKAEQITIIDISKKSSYADTFVIATTRSSRHSEAIANEIVRQLKKNDIACPGPEGRPKCDWVIIDAGSVIVHLFRQEIREYYGLEKLWDISFDSLENKLA